ncbi:hypothetical protein RB195_017809 [Necator americanus]|uniref:phosphoenolpyruvate carboxykinase (GTP) n=1 Tax=Necator americanus TaxID=51031 RepID=A0ABR1C6Y8_NECAM
MSARLHYKKRVTNCDYCAYPHTTVNEVRSVSVPSFCKTDLIIEGYGTIPVLNGDPKWLPTKVKTFVGTQAKLMRPAAIHICNGSFGEAEYLATALEKKGDLEKLTAYDNVFVARTDPSDAEERPTFICSKKRSDVEFRRHSTSSWTFPHWISPTRFAYEIESRFPGCMQGRIMYVIPFSMGPIGGRYSINAVQLTDSAYVVLNMRIITRVSSSIWDAIGNADFVRCVHSVGRPRPVTVRLSSNWICNTDQYFLAHRLVENDVWSYGSAFGQNSFLGKKCVALRLAMYRGWKEGWLVLNAAIVAVKGPSGKEIFGCVSLPIGAGKTQFATMTPAIPGWQVRMLGDDVSWIRRVPEGKLRALTPENGIFGCAINISSKNGENVLKMLSRNAMLVNCASTSKGRFYWEGLESLLDKEERITDWRRENWNADQKRMPTHMNCHFTAFTSAAPNVHPDWERTAGVPISFIIFGCMRTDEMPLVYETESWEHGVIMAAGIRTASRSPLDVPSSALVQDPFCMRTSMSVSFPSLIQHWFDIKQKAREVPKIFMVNWYQEGKDGRTIWPGFGDNIRVLEWIFNRCSAPNETAAVSSPIGLLPEKLNIEGLKVDLHALLKVQKQFWTKEITQIYSFLSAEMGNQKSPVIRTILADIAKRVAEMK